jgi:autotransporter-associated beta strand protein
MKTQRFLLTLACLIALSASALAQTTATWNNLGGDNDWNNSANWDIGVPAEGTNAVIPVANTVNYNAPMAATSFNLLGSLGVLNVSAGGFVVGATGDGAIGLYGSAAKLFINSGGAVTLPNGGLTLSNAAGLNVASGGSLTVAGNFLLGRNGTGNTGFTTNNGGTISAAATSVNPNNNSSTSLLVINDGTSDLGNVIVKRSSAGSGGFNALGTEGLIISNGLVRMTSLDVGGSDGNSFLTTFMANGTVTNTGDMIVRQGSASRSSRFLQTGGLYVCSGPGGVNLRGHTANNSIDIYSVLGGTNLVSGFVLGISTDTTGTIRLTNAAKIYVSSGGFSSQGTLNTKTIALNSGGIFGAQADWSGTEPIILAGGSFDAGNLDGTPQNITLSGVLSGSGALIKNGGGTLTLNVANTYSGQTLINQGTLALGATGSIASSGPGIIVAAGATFDVSAVSGFTLGASRTLGGSGTVTGNVAVASSGIINPGTSAGTLSLSNSLTETGGAVNHFDLPTTPGPGNDLLVINGDLNVSGINTVEINGGGSAGTVHTIIQYGGNFNGTVANFAVSGANGSLSNDVPTKTIAFVVQAPVRSPTNVVWLGNSSVNDWDTVNRTNWLNTGTGSLDYFVTGDNALFSGLGAANPNVNIVGNNAAATVTVDTTANYLFGGIGAISGSASLTKTNTGTLTITNQNTYSGATTIGGGTLVASVLANGGSPSSIGAASAASANLVFDGGALRYTGGSVSIDRGATLNAAGGVIDIPTDATVLTDNGVITGTGALTKTGPGTLTLAGSSDYTNGTVISNGVLRVNAATSAGSGGITNYGATFRLATTTTLANMVDWHGTCTLDLNNTGGNQALDGAWSGNGTVNFINQQSTTFRTFTMGGNGSGGGHMNNFTGVINVGTNNGFFRFNDGGGTFNYGNSNLFLDLGTSTATFLARNRGVTIYLGALAGGSGTTLTYGTDGSGTTTYVIGGRDVDSTMAGTINSASGAPIALTKVGLGTLTLAGSSLHHGPTVISSGTLALSGSGTIGNSPTLELAAGAVLDTSARTDGALVLNSGQTLFGEGTVRGSVTVQSNATVSPGPSAGVIGKLTVTNALTPQPGGILLMEVDQSSATNDVIEGLASVTYGGTLSLNLLFPVDLTSSFKLFNAAAYSGAFDTITPASPGSGWVWDVSKLAVDGTLKVKTFVVTQPNITTASVVGANFTLSGTGGPAYLNYTVYASSDLSQSLINWSPIGTGNFKGDGSFAFTVDISAVGPYQFYAVQYMTP